jgi:long-chain acyl-CoA synthetase
MYPGEYAQQHPDRPALVMEPSGEVVTYGEFEARANRLAQLYRDAGLRRGDHVAFFLENNPHYFELMSAAASSTTATPGCSSPRPRSATWPLLRRR